MSNQPQAQAGRADIGLPVFLTAYDPSDLPGGSLDPLGFERGYLFLADEILPGLTNVANCPRYFSVLCAGAFLAKVDAADPPPNPIPEETYAYLAVGEILGTGQCLSEQ